MSEAIIGPAVPILPGGGSADTLDFESLANQLAESGYAFLPDFLDLKTTRALLAESEVLYEEGEFRRGAVGRGRNRERRAEVRTDDLHWIDRSALTDAQRAYWERMEELRDVLNRTLFLGLFELEAHLARFTPGGFYKPHLDRHQKTLARVLSAVVYLDEGWDENDGGQLRLYTDREFGVEGPYLDVFPRAGRVALFLSGEIWHEVKMSKRPRHTVTGWFRRRPLSE